jgi:hypothetical protein
MDATEDLATALASWAEFPVHAAERPIVPIGTWLREAGYVSSEAKIAFAENRLRVGTDVVTAAVASLVAEIGPLGSEADQPLMVQNAVQIRHAFATDRGPRELPAWSLEVTDSIGPVVIVDIDERGRLWFPPEHARGGGTAHCLDVQCTRLRYRFLGTPTAYADYDGVDLDEGETAVAVLPRVRHTVAPGQPMLLYAEEREVEIQLAEPLGARVLVSATGYPIEVVRPG